VASLLLFNSSENPYERRNVPLDNLPALRRGKAAKPASTSPVISPPPAPPTTGIGRCWAKFRG
jgi:hypothetical protein